MQCSARSWKGQDVVDQMKTVDTGRHGFHDDVPVEPIFINKAYCG